MKECQLCKNCFTDDVNTCPNDGMPTFHSISGEPVLEGKYQLECRLGQGGMGVVYKAKHAYLKTQHAIKIILPDLVGNDPELVTRFRQEALAAAAIRHQNVVGVSDYGVVQGNMPFLVMEYVEGESLHDLLEREGKLPPEKALDLMCAIGAGIGAAHKQGIVHRDLKPLNVMIVKDVDELSEAVKILDFGLAKIKSGELLGSFIQAQTTGLMGSPFYMAPEQWADEEPDATSDIYSLGVILFQMLTGDVPFKGSSIPAIMKKHVSDLPPKFADVGVKINPRLENAVRRSLAKDRKDRPQDVETFVEELKHAVNSTSSLDAANIPGMKTQIQAPPDKTSSLQILTIPPQSQVFIDDAAVGNSQPDGWLMLDGIKSGKHHIRIRHEGFLDFESEFETDGSHKEVVAELQKDKDAIPKPMSRTMPAMEYSSYDTPQNPAEGTQPIPQQTGDQQQYVQTGVQSMQSSLPPGRSFFASPLVLGLAGVLGLIFVVAAGLGGAYLAGVFDSPPIDESPSPAPSTASSPTVVKNEMIEIPGGTFTMGNKQGRENEKPEHEVTVESFLIDKTEVTNAEYYEFIKATGYKKPAHFVNGKPVPGQNKYPVNFVSHQDAVEFAKWRSKRDGVEYRLPTEQEWEYAARNGSKNNLYPWGDEWKENAAVIDRPNGNQLAVGSRSGANQWGVRDLIGNVWEWTSTKASLYPGSKGVVGETKEPYYMIRGGGALSTSEGDLAITSTYRETVAGSEANKVIGFRLVRSP